MGFGESLALGEEEKLLSLEAGGGSPWVGLTAPHPCPARGSLLDKKAPC